MIKNSQALIITGIAVMFLPKKQKTKKKQLSNTNFVHKVHGSSLVWSISSQIHVTHAKLLRNSLN